MATRNITDAVPELQTAYDFAKKEFAKQYTNEPQPFITCVHRTNDEQTQLFAQGRTAPGKIITNARAGQSKHNKMPSEAIDVAFIRLDKKLDWSPKLFKNFAVFMKQKGIKWGGEFKSIPDAPHFEI